jgi:multidrug efflux system membrane fusion protein
MLMKYSVAALLAAVLLLAGCSSAGGKNTQPAPAANAAAAPVKVARAEIRSLPVELQAAGNVEPYSTITVKSQIGGTLMKAHFREGDMVRKGDLLFEIDPRPYEEAIRRWEANLARDRALLQQSEANLARVQAQEAHYAVQADRYLKLAEQGIFSREQADQMAVELKSRRSSVRAEIAGLESARASIRAGEAELENARLNLAYCSIRSPLHGRTGQMLVKEGNLVKANDVDLVTIHQIQPIYVAFAVPEANLPVVRQRLARGGKLAVRATAPETPGQAEGTLTFIDNAVDRATGTVRLKATFANADSRLWPGQFVDVRLRLEERPNAVTVPAAAVQTGQNGNFVYVVGAQNTVELRPVATGERFGDLAGIDRGLTGGEVVVIDGHLRLAPGVSVRILP